MSEYGNSGNKKWLVVVNPNAGTRKGKKDWPKIQELLSKHDFNCHTVFTQNRNHAISINSSAI